MKTQTDRQCHLQDFNGVIPANQLSQRIGIVDEKVIVLEYKEYQASRNNTQPEQPLAFFAHSSLQPDACEVVNDNSQKENQNILRNEKHVKNATRNQQYEILKTGIAFCGKPEQHENDGQKNREFKGVE
jgi:hypothetical protein